MKRTLPVRSPVLACNIRCAQCNAILSSPATVCGICGEKLDKSANEWSRSSILWKSVSVLLPLSAFVLWFYSLRSVNLQHMTDIGFVSVLPVESIVPLIIIVVNFCIYLNSKRVNEPLVFLHIFLLIFMLYGVTTLIEQQPRFSTVYQHAGFTEFIMRTGTVDPYFTAYFNWPGFFIVSAFLTRIAGYHDILSYATWAPIYYNLFYLAPLYIIFTTVTMDKRVIWLGLCIFYLTNWIAQDYYSPQGLNFFLYLLILAILLKWFKSPVTPRQQRKSWRRSDWLSPFIGPIYEWLTAPDPPLTPVQPWSRRALLVSIVAIFAFMVFSHPLTPFFVIAVVTVLVVFGRITPCWLPILMSVMTAAWAVFVAQPYLAGHLAPILSDVGQLSRAVDSNVTGRVLVGDPEHILIGKIRTMMTFIIWGLAFAGAVLRLRRGHRDASYVLLAIVPFPIVLVQSYGGEMLLRIYLFTLPMMSFFAAALFYTPKIVGPGLAPVRGTPGGQYRSGNRLCHAILRHRKAGREPLRRDRGGLGGGVGALCRSWGGGLLMKIIVGVVCVLLLIGFLFTRYGNEQVDYVTNAELTGMNHLYSIAPKGSLLLTGCDETAWQFRNIEQYSYYVLCDDDSLYHALLTKNVAPVIQLIEHSKPSKAYIIFTRSQQALALRNGLPPDTLDQFEHALLTSRMFILVYRNSDVQIISSRT